MLSLLENDSLWDFPRQERSSNPSYDQSKDCSKVDWKDFYDRYCSSAVYSTSTVIHKLNDFRFNHDFSCLPEIMSWDEYAFTKGKMSFIAQDFKKLNIITVLEGRTQTIIRNYFLRYDRIVRCQVKIITMDMFSPYYDLAKQLRFRISRLRLKQSTRLFHSQMQKLYWIAFTLCNT